MLIIPTKWARKESAQEAEQTAVDTNGLFNQRIHRSPTETELNIIKQMFEDPRRQVLRY